MGLEELGDLLVAGRVRAVRDQHELVAVAIEGLAVRPGPQVSDRVPASIVQRDYNGDIRQGGASICPA